VPSPPIQTRPSTFNFASLDAAAHQAALWFVAEGYAPGEGIALLLENEPDFLTLSYGAKRAGLMDAAGKIPGLNRILMTDAVATMVGAVAGTSTVTSYVESAAGVQAGGRTGLTAVVCGLLFLATMFVAPYASLVPLAATAPASRTSHPSALKAFHRSPASQPSSALSRARPLTSLDNRHDPLVGKKEAAGSEDRRDAC
jgi:hypothetical protein